MSNLNRDDFDSGPKHVFCIEEGLWLGMALNNYLFRMYMSCL